MNISQFPDAVAEGPDDPLDGPAPRFSEVAEVERGVFLTGTGDTPAEAAADLREQLADEFNC